jgi:hypothetical protein
MVPRQPAQRAEGRSRPRVLGSGWTAVLEIPGVAGPSGAHRLALPAQLSTPIPGSSNRLIQTALINAVLRADGTVLVGAVRPALLEHLAATTR